MSNREYITNSLFYHELSEQRQKEYFGFNFQYLPALDNIYYTVSVKGDSGVNPRFESLFRRLDEMRAVMMNTHKPAPYDIRLSLTFKSYKIYRYCLSVEDLYDIFLVESLPNEKTPRIAVQIRAYGLWLHGVDEMVFGSFDAVRELLGEYGAEVGAVFENRIDYCYHTNFIVAPEKLFSDDSLRRHLKTTLTRYHFTGRVHTSGEEDYYSDLTRDYSAFGERKSNYVFVRFYNKALEVIEQGYKGFFFELWHKSGLINAYDKYCFEYAYQTRNYNSVHKARLLFYMEHGRDESLKYQFMELLRGAYTTSQMIRDAADRYMPGLTVVFNIEFETKRKFYYLSDKFIDGLSYTMRAGLEKSAGRDALKRLYRIIDNRRLFINYLSGDVLCFCDSRSSIGEDGSVKYCDWWRRLRATRFGGPDVDLKLARVYQTNMDKEIQKKRFINALARQSVLDGSDNTSFIDDVASMLSLLNDNDRQAVSIDGSDGFYSDSLADYQQRKLTYKQQIKNRLVTEVLPE
jgi:hypothetical protein